MDLHSIIPGTKISFVRDPEEFIVKACNERFIICVYIKKFKVRYTIIDIMKKVRGPHNFLFDRYDFSRQYYVERCLNHLSDELSGVTLSKIKTLPLDIKTITPPQEEI